MRPPHPTLAAMRGDVPGLAWPPVPVGGNATLGALLHRLERTQWLPAEELRAHQRVQLGVLGRWFAERSPFVADRLRAAGLAPADLGRPGGLSALPVLTRTEMQASGESLACEPPPGHGPTGTTVTTGSTGTPLTVVRTSVTGLFHAALTLRDYVWQDVDFRRRLSVVRHGPTAIVEEPTWGTPVDPLFASGPVQTVPVSTPIDELADTLERFQPEVLLIYPNVLGGLVAHYERTGASRLGALRVVQTIGETLEPVIRAGAERVLGVRLWDLYSSQEVGVIAADCPEGDQLHVAAENVVVEVVGDDGEPAAEGEVGSVVVTDLHNLATPMLRYEQGDLAEVGGPCPCGRGLPTLRRVLGRHRQLLRLADGRQRWPLFGSHHYREVAPVMQQQIVQLSVDTLEVRLRVESPLTAEQEDGIAAIIRGAVGHPFELRFVYVDGEIARGPGGKFEEFRSEVR